MIDRVKQWLECHPQHHLVRAWCWWIAVPVFVLLGFESSVFVVFIYSTYANFASDRGIYESAKAKIEARS